ncbi:MAG: hypothetical protein QXQ50_09320 [Candidatus Bathyarchaeia archaeon]
MAEVEKDADTGEQIIYFVRKGREYLYLRDSVTKRFIRRLKTVEKRHYAVVDYSKEQAKKGNPLYIDSGAYTQLSPSEFPKRHEINAKLETAIENTITRMFGEAVTKQLLEPAGYEIGSKPYYNTKAQENKATVLVVWKHHPEEPPKKQETEEAI